jgi:hypothetical protein
MSDNKPGDAQVGDEDVNQEAHSYLSELESRVLQFMHDVPESVHEVFKRHRRTAFERHPFLFSTLGLFGLVATWKGFEDIVERISFLEQYPSVLLGIGLVILLITGRLYRHLDQ